MYDPLLHKTPYGATATGIKTHFVFPIDTTLSVRRVFIILRKVHGDGNIGEQYMFELARAKVKDGVVFEGDVVLNECGIYMYRFEGELFDGGTAFFGRGDDGIAIRGDWLPEWQLTVSKCQYKTPHWAKSGVIYHIFADRFCKVGDKPFDKRGRLHTYWNEVPDIQEDGKDYRADDFFGGNIAGIISRLDYLRSLGVTLIYLSPIFESSSNHRYDTGDYMKIDPLFGNEEEFKLLIEKAGALGIKIMLDGVFNHTGADSMYFNKFGRYPTLGAFQSKDSPYFDWYSFSDWPNFYDCWWGSTVVPTVNKSAEGYRRLMLGDGGVVKKWTSMGVKGWRLDVVDELPVDFTYDLCACIKDADPDALIAGEVWEDASNKISYDQWRPYFMGGQLDSVMNYPFKEAILKFAEGGSAREFAASVSSVCEHYPKQSLDVLLNIIGSHDTVRALTVLSGVEAPASKRARADFLLTPEQYDIAKRNLQFAAALQYTLPGVPCVYYGDEAGVQGFEDPLNRSTYPWGREDTELVDYYRRLGRMREKYADLLQGELHFSEAGEAAIFTRRSTMGELRVFANPGDREIIRPAHGVDALSGRKIVKFVRVKPRAVRIVVSD